MKLVTGFEAVESSKPFRYHHITLPPTEWLTTADEYFHTFGVSQLLRLAWEIKPEPREWWLNTETGVAYFITVEGPKLPNGPYTKVREVVDD